MKTKSLLVIFVVALLAIPTLYAQDPTATPDPAAATATPTAAMDTTAEATDDAMATADAGDVVATADAGDAAEATAEPPDASGVTATPVEGTEGGEVQPPFACDTTTVTLLLVAEMFGFSESDFATQAQINLADYDLGDAQTFFDSIDPLAGIEAANIDMLMSDQALSDQVNEFMAQFQMEDVTLLEDIEVAEEDPACFALRQAAQQYVLLNVVLIQFDMQSAE